MIESMFSWTIDRDLPATGQTMPFGAIDKHKHMYGFDMARVASHQSSKHPLLLHSPIDICWRGTQSFMQSYIVLYTSVGVQSACIRRSTKLYIRGGLNKYRRSRDMHAYGSDHLKAFTCTALHLCANFLG